MKAKTTHNLSTTRKSLKRALPFVPPAKKSERMTIMQMAGRLTTPPSAGQAQISGGRVQPMSASMRVKYLLQETLTVTAATAYSNTRSQPIIQATSSPIVT